MRLSGVHNWRADTAADARELQESKQCVLKEAREGINVTRKS